jgi:hypothetical protein
MAKKSPDSENEQKTDLHPPQRYEIRLKPGHPTGIYHRAGLEFSASTPTYLEEVPDAVANDAWLIVSQKVES